MADLGNLKIKDTYTLVLQTDASGNLQNLDGDTPNPFIVNGNLRYADGTQNNGYVLLSDASGNASWGPVAFSGDVYISGGTINGTTIELQASSGGTVSVPGLSWSYDKVTDYISTSGLTSNVGIGTTTPNEKLTVVGDISGTTDLHIGRNITTTNNLTVNVDTLYGDSATGNVGVGNLNPSHKLTISGNTFLSVILGVDQGVVCAEGDVRLRFDGGAVNSALYVGQQLKIVGGDGITHTVTIQSFLNDEVLYLTAPFPGSDVTATSYLYSTPVNTNQFAVYSGTNTAFQVSGDVVMSGSTDLLNIFASSAITNQDVYWSANTDSSISPSGSNATTSVNISGNLGISGITTSTGGFVGDLVGTATTATTVLVTDNESGNDNNLLVFVGEGTTTTGSQSLQMDGDLYYNPSIGKLHVPLTFQMPDNGTIKLGASQDLKLYHDEDNSYIKENGTGDLIIQTNSNVIIEGTGGENCAVFVDEGGVELYYDNSKKFETTTDGVTIPENVNISGHTNINGILSGLTDARFSGNLGVSGNTYLPDNGSLYMGAGNDLRIYHGGSNSIIQNATGNLKIRSTQSTEILGNNTSEPIATFTENGSVELYYDNSKKFETTVDGVTIPENLNISGTTTLTAGGATFYPRPNLYWFANCDAATYSPATDGSFPSTNTTDVSWGETFNSHEAVYSFSAEELTIERAGIYQFTYNVTLETGADGSASNRTGGGVVLLKDGTVVNGTESYVYCRMATPQTEKNTGTISVMLTVVAGEVFKIVFIRTGASNAGSKLGTIPAGTAWTVEAVT